ncbi:zinc finger protein 160-like [Pollicipes pollicipes]|uniref:zinc finger protein 160-like n=1 Tax=Pollicipes pollicipes TaxID=41117 RepID=UPI001884F238|nr:zinc finger protein 160-like [Pollicipes pollicipes]
MTRLRQALGCTTEVPCECGYHEATIQKRSLARPSASEEDRSRPGSRPSDARSEDVEDASYECAGGGDEATPLGSAKLEEKSQLSAEADQHHELRQVDVAIHSPSVKTEPMPAEDVTRQYADHVPQGETLPSERRDPEPVRAAEYPPAYTSVVLLLLPPDAMAPYRCQVCGDSFSSQASLSAHGRSHTQARRLPVCDVCGKVFVDSASASHHRLWHARQIRPRDRYMCDYCGKLYASWASLSGHYSRMHATGNARRLIMPKKYRCENCGRRFRTGDDLARHRRFEAGVLYGCEICGKSCSDELGLDRHRRTHTTCAPFPCSVCKKLFGTVADLSQHYRQHPGPKSIVCEVCGEAFLEKSHRTEHYRIHIEDRPFKCDVCGKEFRLRKQRTRHMGSHDETASC